MHSGLRYTLIQRSEQQKIDAYLYYDSFFFYRASYVSSTSVEAGELSIISSHSSFSLSILRGELPRLPVPFSNALAILATLIAGLFGRYYTLVKLIGRIVLE